MNVLFEEAKKFGINLDELQLSKFEEYKNFLLEYNSHTNLTSITDPKDIAIKHFLDSILVNKFFEVPKNSKVIDVGTGAGFPGVPLKILREDINLTLLDSLNKRIKFLNELCEKIEIKADIIHARAEELSHKENYREKFDVAVSRAVAPLNILCEYCIPYLKTGGYFVSLKGSNFEEEIENSKNALGILGAKIQDVKSFELPENKGFRSIVIIKKIKDVSKKYPRSNSQISKKPL